MSTKFRDFTPISNTFINRLGQIKPIDSQVYLILYHYTNTSLYETSGQLKAWPSYDIMLEILGICRSQLKKSLNRLWILGYINHVEKERFQMEENGNATWKLRAMVQYHNAYFLNELTDVQEFNFRCSQTHIYDNFVERFMNTSKNKPARWKVRKNLQKFINKMKLPFTGDISIVIDPVLKEIGGWDGSI